MNPLDLKGPEFLQLYFVACLVGEALVVALLWLLRPRGDERAAVPPLEPLDVACLAGGAERVIEAWAGAHLQSGALACDVKERVLYAPKDSPPADASAADQALWRFVRAQGKVKLPDLVAGVRHYTREIEARLAAAGLVMTSAQRKVQLAPALLIYGALFALGAAKVWVGISRGRPVTFLVIALGLLAYLASYTLNRRPHRTTRGDRTLSRLKYENQAVISLAPSAGAAAPTADVMLAIGLTHPMFRSGDGASLVRQLSESAFTSGASGSSCSSGCGSSCGGGCGGGCGGCGS